MAAEYSTMSTRQNDLLPNVVDRLGRENPDAAYGLWPVSATSYEEGFRTITYSQLANVVNGLAWWLVEQLGGHGHGEALTYVGPNDVRLAAMAIAAIKAGYVLFLTSPRNSSAAHRALFESLQCQTLLTPDPVSPAAQEILKVIKPHKLTVPSVSSLLDTTHPSFEYNKTFEDSRLEPFWIMLVTSITSETMTYGNLTAGSHTSGSTGLPKPLIWTHETASRHLNLNLQKAPYGVSSFDVDHYQKKRVIVTVPPFHGAGLIQYLQIAIAVGNVNIAPVAASIPTAQGLVDILKQTRADVALLVPSVVTELAQDSKLLDYVATRIELIVYVGGDLPQAIGDQVAAKVRLRCMWGASEVGIPNQLWPSEFGSRDWRYVRFHPAVGAVFEEAVDGFYELVIRRDHQLSDTQPAFSIRGQQELSEYRTRDLFERHPTIPDAWCWKARADDIIVFLNGEKTNPVTMEQYIVASNSELSGAIVIGAQRFQAALLIEPRLKNGGEDDNVNELELIERVWPSVQEANSVAPAHARIEKSMILVTIPTRPLLRAGKGTIQRSTSIARYEHEINRLYDAVDKDEPAGAMGDSKGPLNMDDTVKTIRGCLTSITTISNPDDTTGFFDAGMDSLQALQLTSSLRRSLHRPDVTLSTIYQNPSIIRLAKVLCAETTAPGQSDSLEHMLDFYRSLLQQTPAADQITASEVGSLVNVVLTGSTGTLGTFILRALLDRPGIGRVYCLNRTKDGGRTVQIERFARTNLVLEGLDERVNFLQADLSQPLLGLESSTYEDLRANAGLFIHNAWPVNFNLSLSEFRPQLAGLVNLFALSASKPFRQMKVVFISSIGAVSGRKSESGPAPESIIEASDTPYANGYGQSKFIAEHICEFAAKHLNVPVSIARVGQIAGAVRQPGVWNRTEWLPSLIASSIYLGCLPSDLGPQFTEVDCIPVDLLADILIDIAGDSTSKIDGETGAKVFNLRNPHTQPWWLVKDAVVETVKECRNQTLEMVPPQIWLEHLQDSISATNQEDRNLESAVVSNPGIKLFDFYQNGLWGSQTAAPPMLIDHAVAASQTLRNIPPIRLDWMRKWVQEWIGA